MRNHEGYIDLTAYKAIKRADRRREKKPRPWGDRLTYTVGEVMRTELLTAGQNKLYS